jgi:spermidine/putrescine transport system substrate-binding protein
MNSIKRQRPVLAVMVVFALAAAACGGDADPTQETPGEPTTPVAPEDISGTLRVFTYDDSLAKWIVEPFQEMYPNIQLEGSAFADSPLNKLRGGFEADVIETCAGEMRLLLQGEYLAPIDTSRIPEWDNLYPYMKNAPEVQVDGQVFEVPSQGGIDGIIYNRDVIPDGTISGYADLFAGDWEGYIGVDDDPTDVIPMAALALGYSDIWNLTSAQLQEIHDYLDETGRIRTTVETDADQINLMLSEEIHALQSGPELATTLNAEGGNFGFVVPEEGVLSWVCGMSLSSDAENIDAAYAWINYFADPDLQLTVAERYEYWPSHPSVLDAASEELRERVQLDAAEGLADETIIEDTPENLDEWEDTWRQFLSG